jgi:L-ascorbate metabolism protein UlaG (beta-lactamase superfamily)
VEDGKVLAPGVPAGLIVRYGGAVIYFAGDTALFGDMQLIGEEGLDVAVLPIGDHFTMGPADAVRAAKFLKATTVVPCHYNTFPPIKQDAGAFKETIDRDTDSTAVILEPGESFTISGKS